VVAVAKPAAPATDASNLDFSTITSSFRTGRLPIAIGLSNRIASTVPSPEISRFQRSSEDVADRQSPIVKFSDN
jgi:hypothetical protein